jgi:hypothetical protein
MLVARGYKVRALSQYNSFNNWGWLEDIDCGDKVEVLTGDIRDPHYCKFITKDIEVILCSHNHLTVQQRLLLMQWQ